MKKVVILLFTFLLMVSCATHMDFVVPEPAYTYVNRPVVITVKKPPIYWHGHYYTRWPYNFRHRLYTGPQHRMNTHRPPVPSKPSHQAPGDRRNGHGPGPNGQYFRR